MLCFYLDFCYVIYGRQIDLVLQSGDKINKEFTQIVLKKIIKLS